MIKFILIFLISLNSLAIELNDFQFIKGKSEDSGALFIIEDGKRQPVHLEVLLESDLLSFEDDFIRTYHIDKFANKNGILIARLRSGRHIVDLPMAMIVGPDLYFDESLSFKVKKYLTQDDKVGRKYILDAERLYTTHQNKKTVIEFNNYLSNRKAKSDKLPSSFKFQLGEYLKELREFLGNGSIEFDHAMSEYYEHIVENAPKFVDLLYEKHGVDPDDYKYKDNVLLAQEHLDQRVDKLMITFIELLKEKNSTKNQSLKNELSVKLLNLVTETMMTISMNKGQVNSVRTYNALASAAVMLSTFFLAPENKVLVLPVFALSLGSFIYQLSKRDMGYDEVKFTLPLFTQASQEKVYNLYKDKLLGNTLLMKSIDYGEIYRNMEKLINEIGPVKAMLTFLRSGSSQDSITMLKSAKCELFLTNKSS